MLKFTLVTCLLCHARRVLAQVDNDARDRLELALKPGKDPGVELAIDHIQKPSEN